jgi:hypothetical protein
MVGYFLPTVGIKGLFLIFGIVGWIGFIAAFFAIEPRGRVLEEISP